MKFSEYLDSVTRTANGELSLELQVLNASLSFFEETGEVISHYKKHMFHGHPLSSPKVESELGDVLFYLSWLFLCANEGNSLDESSLEMTFHWDILPSEDIEVVPAIASLATVANKNLQNVVQHGLLERTAFYPGFRYLAALAKFHNRKLSDIAAANSEKLKIRYPESFTAEASIARVDVESPV